MMEPLLYLVHRIPYPPNKGDKVRSFHLLKYLSKHFDIYLGAFVDDLADWKYEKKLEPYCKDINLVPLNPLSAKMRGLTGLLSGDALSIYYYRDARMRRWVKNITHSKEIKKTIIFSSPMAQYVYADNDIAIKIADFVDIDSDKWMQYSKNHSFPVNYIYQREARTLLKYEQKIAKNFDATLFVSEIERNDFNKCVPESKHKHLFYNNGVDYEYFNPALELKNPFPPESVSIVFTGAMDYWANVDAVKWFAESIFPHIKICNPHAKFYIVGSNPTADVIELTKDDSVVVTGRVEDIRSYIKFANLVVAPMRIARGIQNKVLEAMAMEKTIVATSLALEGVANCDNYKPYCADTENVFSEICNKILQDKNIIENPLSRVCIENHYNWEKNIQMVIGLLRSGQ